MQKGGFYGRNCLLFMWLIGFSETARQKKAPVLKDEGGLNVFTTE